jgi:integrase
MAAVSIPPGRSVYYAKFRYKRKVYFLSTGKTVKKDATTWMNRKIAEVQGKTNLHELFDRVLSIVSAIPDEKKQEEIRQGLIKRLRQDRQHRVLLAEAWALFDDTPRQKSQGTDWRKVSKAWFGRFLTWMEENHPVVEYMDEVSPVMANAYARHLNSEGTTASTYNRKVHSLKLVFKTLKTDAGLTENVWGEIQQMHATVEGQRPLEDNEVRLVLVKAHEQGDPVLALWLLLGIYTGLRLKDVVTLTWANVNFEQKMISRVAAKTRKYSNGQPIPIPMAAPLEVALKAYRRTVPKSNEAYLFPEYAKDYKDGGKDRAEGMIGSIYESCGIRRLRENSGKRKRRSTEVGFHSLRHTFVTMCADNSVPLHDVQAMVGHMTSDMTKTYMHSSLAGKRKAVKALPDFTAAKKKPSKRKAVKKTKALPAAS